ncbi:MAG: DUF5615 family PIN-like protein [Nitrospira sp.]|nr:DUF5615 family PIN-like protein [Nitrospira sp.]
MFGRYGPDAHRGHDIRHFSEEGLERLSDPLILKKAEQEERLIMTCDLDFADLLALSARSLLSAILVRLQDQTPGSVIPRLVQVLNECREALTSGAIVTIEEARYRLRRKPGLQDLDHQPLHLSSSVPYSRFRPRDTQRSLPSLRRHPTGHPAARRTRLKDTSQRGNPCLECSATIHRSC